MIGGFLEAVRYPQKSVCCCVLKQYVNKFSREVITSLILQPFLSSLLQCDVFVLHLIFTYCISSGEKGVSVKTGKPLHYKGTFFHRIIEGYVAQVCNLPF